LSEGAEAIEEVYEDFISTQFSSIPRNRYVYKSSDIREKLSLSSPYRFINVLGDLYSSLLDIDSLSIVILYTTFNTQKLPHVTYYGHKRTPQRTIKTINFLDNLQQYYCYVCAWKVLKEWQYRCCDVLLDAFEGEITNSWDELTHHHNVNIYFGGDQCNPLIASADIITRFVDELLAFKRLKLESSDIMTALNGYKAVGEKVKVYYIGHTDLPNIVPAINRSVDKHVYYKKPSVFLLPEGVVKKEKAWVEKSPVYDRLLNFASKIGGGFKRIDGFQDHVYLNQRPNSFLVYQGENGQREAEYLKEVLAYPVKIISIRDIDNGELG